METGRPGCTVSRTEAGPGSGDRPQFTGTVLVTMDPRVIAPRVLSGRSTGTTNVFFMNPPFRESDSRNLPPGPGSGKLLYAGTRGRGGRYESEGGSQPRRVSQARCWQTADVPARRICEMSPYRSSLGQLLVSR